MKNKYNNVSLPPIEWYIGDTLESNGELKLEWSDPAYGKALYSEEQLLMIEQSARDMLINRHEEVVSHWGGWTKECHAYWRDRHYNAEYGLEKLQTAKLNRGLPLNSKLRPVVR
jgi:hypothetical protein